MKKEMPKAYNPADCEQEIYQKWEASGFFNPDNLDLPEDAESYTITLPPPNITDKLHMGHSSMLAIEDLLIRYHRMQGFRTLWIPGTDHAAIATQNAVEKKLFKETGKTRHDLGKEKFLQEVWKFLKETQATILNQTRRMGSSLDWSREAFTLDDQRKEAVKEMFIDMYRAGAIYRGERIVNWCPRCHSTLADDEVEYENQKGTLYTFKYDENFPIEISTTRPETKLGDVAVAVNPEDERYKEFIGQEFKAIFCGVELKIKIIADMNVDKNFGTGAVGITPAHSMIDWQIAQKHGLDMIKVIDEEGDILEGFGDFSGLKTVKAREKIVEKLKEKNLIKEDEMENNLSVCYRCGSVIEPLPSKQWFVSVDKKLEKLGGNSLKEKAVEVVKQGKIKFIPKRFEKRYLDWMENLHDWCISRQIWFGHEIPAYYKDDEVYVGEEKPKEKGWAQDPDSLDTWFSSGMWTFSTLGWPSTAKAMDGKTKKTGDLAKFHPTQVLETGYDILTLWVSRMIMMTLFALDEVPFENVYLHGLVLDKNGKKMSKSKGNGIDPIDMIEQYGADATRLSLLIGSSPGNDIRIFQEKIEGQRNFINKLWNISRYILTNTSLPADSHSLSADNLTLADAWILNKMKILIDETKKDLSEYNFSSAGEKLRDFTWNEFADWYLEISKLENNKEIKSVILKKVLNNLLKLWHPFIPFVTEKIYSETDSEKMLMVEEYPSSKDYTALNVENNFSPADFEIIKKVISAVRTARAEYKILPTNKINVVIYSKKFETLLKKEDILIKNLGTNIDQLEISPTGEKIAQAFYAAVPDIEIYIPLKNVIDIEKEKQRLKKEIEQADKFSSAIKNQLKNKKFIQNAPKEIIEKEKEKLFSQENKIKEIKKQLQSLE